MWINKRVRLELKFLKTSSNSRSRTKQGGKALGQLQGNNKRGDRDVITKNCCLTDGGEKSIKGRKDQNIKPTIRVATHRNPSP